MVLEDTVLAHGDRGLDSVLNYYTTRFLMRLDTS